MARKRRKIRVVHKKLGREQVFGYTYKDGVIYVDPRPSARSYLNTLVHECLHVLFPEASETKVTRSACALTRVLWEQRYRRVSK